MALEEQIVEWSASRPGWQRLVLQRVATGDGLSNEDYDQIIDNFVADKPGHDVTFGLADLPKTTAEDPPVRLVSIAKPEHVNALASEHPLTFEPNGLTLIYGDNGSGKSGYARLLKLVTRARDQEDILTDVFHDTSLEKPSANLSIRIGRNDKLLTWPDSTPPELQRMLFYDGACGSAYIATESDFPYRPSALFVMDGLIRACVELRARIDARLAENEKSQTAMPVVAGELRDTKAGKFLNGLSENTSVEVLDILIGKLDEASESVDELRDQEIRLRKSDTSVERQNLAREADKLDALSTHIGIVHAALANGSLKTLEEQRDQILVFEEAANLLARTFASEPLPGVGTSPWKELWDSAKRFSEEHAYHRQEFPVVDDDSRCVLCQQTLDDDGRSRLLRFDQFVRDDTQIRLNQARSSYEIQKANLVQLVVLPEAVENFQKDLEGSHAELIAGIRALLGTYDSILERTCDALEGTGRVPPLEIEPTSALTRLAEASNAARMAAEELSNPEVVRQRLTTVTRKRQELELLHEIKNSGQNIINEINRLKERKALEAIKTAAANHIDYQESYGTVRGEYY